MVMSHEMPAYSGRAPSLRAALAPAPLRSPFAPAHPMQRGSSGILPRVVPCIPPAEAELVAALQTDARQAALQGGGVGRWCLRTRLACAAVSIDRSIYICILRLPLPQLTIYVSVEETLLEDLFQKLCTAEMQLRRPQTRESTQVD